MYKIIVVDDEEIVRRSIVKKIDWEAIGFDQPYQACDGHEALELALDVEPDLVFADIKMPIMDGLELASHLKEQLPNTHVVIFSGYDDFSYAQESITLGVLDYILKPLGSVTLTKKLTEIRKKLDQKHKKKEVLDKMKDQLHKSLPLLKESFLNGLVCSPASMIYSDKRMHSLDIKLESDTYLISVIEPKFGPSDTEFIDVYLFGIKNIISETIGPDHHYFTDASGRLVIVFCSSDQKGFLIDRDIIIKSLHVLLKAFNYNLKLTSTIGLSHPVDTLDHLYDAYNEALTAIDCKYQLGTNKIYDFTDLDYVKTAFYYPRKRSEKFISAVKANNQSDMMQALKALADSVTSQSDLSLANLKFVYIELVTNLTKLMAETKKTSPALWSKTLDLYRIIEAFESMDMVTDQIKLVAFELSSNLSEMSVSSRKNLVLSAITYLKEHYSDESLSQKTVAAHIAVSTGYLSAIFKAEEGVNFNTFLTNIRMEEAKHLLSTTDMNIYDIAYSTGHSNSHYFSVSFKKFSGQSPSDYRQLVMNQ